MSLLCHLLKTYAPRFANVTSHLPTQASAIADYGIVFLSFTESI